MARSLRRCLRCGAELAAKLNCSRKLGSPWTLSGVKDLLLESVVSQWGSVRTSAGTRGEWARCRHRLGGGHQKRHMMSRGPWLQTTPKEETDRNASNITQEVGDRHQKTALTLMVATLTAGSLITSLSIAPAYADSTSLVDAGSATTIDVMVSLFGGTHLDGTTVIDPQSGCLQEYNPITGTSGPPAGENFTTGGTVAAGDGYFDNLEAPTCGA